jgi:DNA-binding XRE family transcriptional regulator
MSILAEVARQHRVRLGMSKADFARHYGFTPASCSYWEAGKRRVPDTVLEDAIIKGNQAFKWKLCPACNGTGLVETDSVTR